MKSRTYTQMSQVKEAVAAGRKLTGLIQKKDYSAEGRDAVADEFTRIDSALDSVPDTQPLKMRVLNALNDLRSAYDSRLRDSSVNADAPTTKLNEVLSNLEQTRGGLRRKTRRRHTKKRSTRRRR